ncbi:Peptide deformylase [Roseibacterium elongatum DSM 19469]|uniref:Peptide deformylase n=1 Tax=Roseicyclus elongatus DSM 19469 TaxID=1294273 RepID=W8RRU7_9RHOB|nr:peptide deformylase [Roseibacterium elongatum]AHM03833.1 Peptide deformylase [Roseibacterium elongatum DSM 19469]
MAVRPVVLAPDPVVSRRCAAVERFDGALGELAMDLLQTLYAAEGRGLAAPQIGVSARIFVTDTTWKAGKPSPTVFVNPEIVAASENTAIYEERCLSIPDRAVRVTRPAWVDLRWCALSGEVRQARFDGFDAVCVQHERDHLDGILITEAAAP